LNAPIILIVITGQAQKSMPVGALHLLGLAGEDYEAKGAVQMAQDNFDCGLREDPRGSPAQLSLATDLTRDFPSGSNRAKWMSWRETMAEEA
jgi:hypothetical protein